MDKTHARTRYCLLFAGLMIGGSAAAQSYSKSETIIYHDNMAKWVVGQTTTVTDIGTGLVQSATMFDASSVLPVTTAQFGKLQATMSYASDGTLATVRDGNNQTTTLSDWKRGIPQRITFADGNWISSTVDDNGWVTSVTDENGNRTCYGYDAMGRLNAITYPSESSTLVCDTSKWAGTSRAFVQVSWPEYGIPAGHWRETVTTGNASKITYYDGMWRPLLVREYDANDVAGTERFTKTAYDAIGRPTFATYPSTSAVAAAQQASDRGVTTFYDALGRVSSVSQDSEQGLLTTLTSYGNGFTTTVTNPRGHATTTTYLTYDQPGTDMPMSIVAPENATTTIDRDVFGKVLAITRSGGTVVPVIRRYAYNAAQELCSSTEPETGVSLYAYDGAGNLTSSSVGSAANTSCGATSARAVNRTYDARNRLKTLSFPDGNGNQTWNYTPDGLPSSVVTMNAGNAVTNSYAYNRRRLIIGEAMVPDAVQTGWTMGYDYNSLGHLTTESYPATVVASYGVNGLGQVTSVSASSDGGAATVIANGASYFANGALRTFRYGNGILHTMTQNARLLPSRSSDGSVLDMATTFDANGNVASVADYVGAGRQSRSLAYDGLDRLTSATSPMFGTANYVYDTLDNLRQVSVTGGAVPRNHYYCYNASSRQLDFVRSGPSCSGVGSPAVVTLGYDVQGNVLYRNGANYAFDYGNRLRGVAGLTYRYDAQGRRVRQDSAGSQLKYSFYSQDGKLRWQRDEPASKRISNLYLAGSLIAEYSRVVGSPVVTVQYLHTDALGSPIARTNSAGAVVETSEYEPYGKLTNRANDDRAGYTGHVMDSASGLTYMQQRYYDPVIGRFLSVDPVTAYSNPVGAFNRYWYGANNPYKFADPDGRDPRQPRGGSHPDEDRMEYLARQEAARKRLEEIANEEARIQRTASIKTYMRSGKTVLTRGRLTWQWQSRNAVSRRSLPNAAGPYTSEDVYPIEGPYKGKNHEKEYGPNDILRTDDIKRGRWLHGGGTGLKDPLAPRQGWVPTLGCTRMQNEDIQSLVDMVRAFKAEYPGQAVPYERSNE